MRGEICTITGVIGSIITTLFGGWDAGLTTLLIFMVIDYVSGLVVAGVFHNSTKTDSGALESRAGWKGLCRKGMTLLLVIVVYRLELAVDIHYIRDALIIGFIANETISITENAALMGIPLDKFPALAQAIDVLTTKAKQEVNHVQANEKEFTE